MNVIDSIGLASVNLMQFDPEAAILCEITCNDSHWTVQGQLKVTNFGTDQNQVCDFLLMNNTTLYITLQPRYNAPRYSAVSVITFTRDGPQFLAIKMHYN